MPTTFGTVTFAAWAVKENSTQATIGKAKTKSFEEIFTADLLRQKDGCRPSKWIISPFASVP